VCAGWPPVVADRRVSAVVAADLDDFLAASSQTIHIALIRLRDGGVTVAFESARMARNGDGKHARFSESACAERLAGRHERRSSQPVSGVVVAWLRGRRHHRARILAATGVGSACATDPVPAGRNTPCQLMRVAASPLAIGSTRGSARARAPRTRPTAAKPFANN